LFALAVSLFIAVSVALLLEAGIVSTITAIYSVYSLRPVIAVSGVVASWPCI
jgi:hypothetical protein